VLSSLDHVLSDTDRRDGEVLKETLLLLLEEKVRRFQMKGRWARPQRCAHPLYISRELTDDPGMRRCPMPSRIGFDELSATLSTSLPDRPRAIIVVPTH
jgi:hypothetical protein